MRIDTEMKLVEQTHQIVTEAWLLVSSVPAATAYAEEHVASERTGALSPRKQSAYDL
jgi:hypothetical protein